MLHEVPLAGLRRIMTNYQADVQLVRKLLEVTLPGATPATVAAAAWAWPAPRLAVRHSAQGLICSGGLRSRLCHRHVT